MNKACGSLIIPLKRINVDLHHKPCKCHLAGLSKSLHSIILSSDFSIVICLHACLPHTHVASKKNTLIIVKSNNKTRIEEIDGRQWAENLSSVDTIHSSLPFCLPLSCYMLKVLDSPTTQNLESGQETEYIERPGENNKNQRKSRRWLHHCYHRRHHHSTFLDRMKYG